MSEYTYSIVAGKIATYLPTNETVEILRWQTTPPTVPGWYWVKAVDREAPLVKEVYFTDGAMVVLYGSGPLSVLAKHASGTAMFSAWLGPLPVPEVPEWLDSFL